MRALVLVLWPLLALGPLSAATAPGEMSIPPASLLPPASDGWVPDGADVVHGPATLYEYIDGAAELYLSYGVRGVRSRRYLGASDRDAEITVDLFDLGTAANAFGLYAHGRERAEAEIGQGSEYGGGLLVFWQGRYYASVLGSPPSAGVERAVRAIGRAVAAAIGERGELPALVTALPERGLLPASVRYFRHPAWINSHLFVAAENVLLMDGECEAALARYDHGGRRFVLLVVRYPDPARARAGHDSFARAWPPGADGGPARREDGSWSASAVAGDRLAAIFGAPDAATAKEALARALAPAGGSR